MCYINDEVYDLSRANYQNSSWRPGLPSEYAGILGVSVAGPIGEPVWMIFSIYNKLPPSNTHSESGGYNWSDL